MSIEAMNEEDVLNAQYEHKLTFLNLKNGKIKDDTDFEYVDGYKYGNADIHDLINKYDAKLAIMGMRCKVYYLGGSVRMVTDGDLPPVIPDWVNSIEKFNKAPGINMRSLELGKNTYLIEKRVFEEGKIDHLKINENLMFIGQMAFNGCKTTEIKLPKNFLIADNTSFIRSRIDKISIYDCNSYVGLDYSNPPKIFELRSNNTNTFGRYSLRSATFDTFIAPKNLSNKPTHQFEAILDCYIKNLVFKDMPQDF